MFEWLQYLGELGCDHIVVFNDEKLVEEISEMNPKGIVISPGPGEPSFFSSNSVIVTLNYVQLSQFLQKISVGIVGMAEGHRNGRQTTALTGICAVL